MRTNPLKALRRRRRPLVAQLLAMLGVVWLNMVLQPCLMAAEPDMSGMDMDMHAGMSMPCPHCPEGMSDDCGATKSSGCAYVDTIDYDGRGLHAKLSKKADFDFVALSAFTVGDPEPSGTCATGPPRDAGSGPPTPPINVLNCVYLK